jgi:Xaa-Pro aminopeptidase
MKMFILSIIMSSVVVVAGASLTSCQSTVQQKNTSTILADLRREMRNEGIGVYIVSSDDEHGSEYTQSYDKRRDWISGFRGSAGVAIVSLRAAALWTDDRYFTQAEEELDCAHWHLMRAGRPDVPSIINWFLTESNHSDLVSSFSIDERTRSR